LDVHEILLDKQILWSISLQHKYTWEEQEETEQTEQAEGREKTKSPTTVKFRLTTVSHLHAPLFLSPADHIAVAASLFLRPPLYLSVSFLSHSLTRFCASS
jgi:hypothetical protein